MSEEEENSPTHQTVQIFLAGPDLGLAAAAAAAVVVFVEEAVEAAVADVGVAVVAAATADLLRGLATSQYYPAWPHERRTCCRNSLRAASRSSPRGATPSPALIGDSAGTVNSHKPQGRPFSHHISITGKTTCE